MPNTEVVIPTVNCKRCGHEWSPRKAKPIACPNCYSRKWDRES